MKSREISCVVLVATPNPSVRRRWKQELENLFLIQTANTRSSLYRMVGHLNPSLLLLDLAMPGFAVSQGILHLLRISPSTKVLAFSQTPNGSEASSVLKAGARGYCDLHIDQMLLQKAIHMMQKGELWINRQFVTYILSEMVIKRTRRGETLHHELKKLTERERQIALRIATGASNKEVADQLNIREATVKAHLTNIFLKLGVSDRLGLVLHILRPQLPASFESLLNSNGANILLRGNNTIKESS